MSAVALGLYGFYLLVAFGARTWVHLRATGRSGWNGLSGCVGSPEWYAGLLFVVALVAGASAPVLDLLGVVPRIEPLDRASGHAFGLVLYAIGFSSTVFAQWRMGNAWRIGVDASEVTELVTTGPFRWVRNPIFSAMLPAALGLVALVPNWVGLGGWLGLWIALQLQVRLVEEPYLLRVHGKRYQQYAAQVGRFVPGIGRFSA